MYHWHPSSCNDKRGKLIYVCVTSLVEAFNITWRESVDQCYRVILPTVYQG